VRTRILTAILPIVSTRTARRRRCSKRNRLQARHDIEVQRHTRTAVKGGGDAADDHEINVANVELI
jgi:hypothetical protein